MLSNNGGGEEVLEGVFMDQTSLSGKSLRVEAFKGTIGLSEPVAHTSGDIIQDDCRAGKFVAGGEAVVKKVARNCI
jgi:hypothetical protein